MSRNRVQSDLSETKRRRQWKIHMDFSRPMSKLQLENVLTQLFQTKVNILTPDIHASHRPCLSFSFSSWPATKKTQWRKSMANVMYMLLEHGDLLFQQGTVLFDKNRHRIKDIHALWVAVDEPFDGSLIGVCRAIELGFDESKQQQRFLFASDTDMFCLMSSEFHVGAEWYRNVIERMIHFFPTLAKTM